MAEQVEQAVADLGEQKVQLQRLAKAAADLQQAAQPLGRLVLEDHVAALAEHGLDGGVVGLLLVAVVALVAVEEDELGVADADAVVVLERRAVADGLAVDEGAVAALLVFDEAAPLDAEDLGVLAADGGDGDDDAAIGVASHDELVAVQRDLAALVGPLDDLKRGHHVTPGDCTHRRATGAPSGWGGGCVEKAPYFNRSSRRIQESGRTIPSR